MAALPSTSFANTSNSSKPHTDMDRVDIQASQSPRLRTALPSARSFPALKGEVCRASDHVGSGSGRRPSQSPVTTGRVRERPPAAPYRTPLPGRDSSWNLDWKNLRSGSIRLFSRPLYRPLPLFCQSEKWSDSHGHIPDLFSVNHKEPGGTSWTAETIGPVRPLKTRCPARSRPSDSPFTGTERLFRFLLDDGTEAMSPPIPG